MPGRKASLMLLALAALTVRPARAEVDYRAKPLVDRYIAESGGVAALAADTVLHEKAHIRAGRMVGTMEGWWMGPTRLLQISRVGPVHARMGFDGTSAWMTDLDSKKVTAIEGKQLEAMRADAWFESEQWARPDQGGGRILPGQHSYSRGRGLDAIDVTPPVGEPRTIWFDAETGLIARVTKHRDQHSWNEDYADWALVAGRKRSMATTIGDSLLSPDTYVRINVDVVRAEPPGDLGSFSPMASAAQPLAWLKSHGIARLPFRYSRRAVWVTASVNGAPPAQFILDTGCSMTAIDRAYARQIELPQEGTAVSEGVGGEDVGSFGKVHTLRVAGPTGDGVEVRDFKVGVTGLQDDMMSLEWDKPAGLLGYDFLGRFVVDIDFDHQVLTLYDPATFVYRGHGQALPITLYSCVPTVPVRLNSGCEGQFMVDVGNASVMMVHTAQVERCHLFGLGSKQVEHWVGGVGGAIPETVCRLDSMRVGPFEWNEPVAGLTLHHFGIAGSKDLQGNLGTSVLERFHCTFDYARRQLWLEPGARYPQRDSFTRAGLWVERHEGVVMVVGVVKHSPAEKAGLKMRDALRAVNGRAIDLWTPEQLDQLFDHGPVGSTVKLTIERDLNDQKVELTLADVL